MNKNSFLPSLPTHFFVIFLLSGFGDGGFWLLANLFSVPTCFPIYATYPPTYVPT